MKIKRQFIRDISVPTNTVTAFYLQFTPSSDWIQGALKFELATDLLALNILACKIPQNFSPAISDNLGNSLLLGYSLDNGVTIKIAVEFTKDEVSSNKFSDSSNNVIILDLRKYEVSCKFILLRQDGVISRHYHLSGDGTFLSQSKISELSEQKRPDYSNLQSQYDENGGLIPESEFPQVNDILIPKDQTSTISDNDPSEFYSLGENTLWFLGQNCSKDTLEADDKWTLIKLDEYQSPSKFEYPSELTNLMSFAVPRLWNGNETPIQSIMNSTLRLEVECPMGFALIRGINQLGQFQITCIDGDSYLIGNPTNESNGILIYNPIVDSSANTIKFKFSGPYFLTKIISSGDITISNTTDATGPAFPESNRYLDSYSKFHKLGNGIIGVSQINANPLNQNEFPNIPSKLMNQRFIGINTNSEKVYGTAFLDFSGSSYSFGGLQSKYKEKDIPWKDCGNNSVYSNVTSITTLTFVVSNLNKGVTEFVSQIGKGPIKIQLSSGTQIIDSFYCCNQKLVLDGERVASTSGSIVPKNKINLIGDLGSHISFMTGVETLPSHLTRFAYNFSGNWIKLDSVNGTPRECYAYVDSMSVKRDMVRLYPRDGDSNADQGFMVIFTFNITMSSDTSLVPLGEYETCTYNLCKAWQSYDVIQPLCAFESTWVSSVTSMGLTTPIEYSFRLSQASLLPSAAEYTDQLGDVASYAFNSDIKSITLKRVI